MSTRVSHGVGVITPCMYTPACRHGHTYTPATRMAQQGWNSFILLTLAGLKVSPEQAVTETQCNIDLCTHFAVNTQPYSLLIHIILLGKCFALLKAISTAGIMN